ncbi:hypothetical protein [Rhizobium sp. SL86]|uniref:hypothetical protein n=1 Tax=Rhizobium sp. SL86 TaxID=2995148 RepID=UPI0022729FEB|nr:hypothetical protein [Rhizobium sp. SL86]MCY1665317.1 hypothetical protein [Rhizobium sp. SL86]
MTGIEVPLDPDQSSLHNTDKTGIRFIEAMQTKLSWKTTSRWPYHTHTGRQPVADRSAHIHANMAGAQQTKFATA